MAIEASLRKTSVFSGCSEPVAIGFPIVCVQATYLPNRSQLCTPANKFALAATMTKNTAQAERFFADRAAPICSFDVGQSFAQLRYWIFCRSD